MNPAPHFLFCGPPHCRVTVSCTKGLPLVRRLFSGPPYSPFRARVAARFSPNSLRRQGDTLISNFTCRGRPLRRAAPSLGLITHGEHFERSDRRFRPCRKESACANSFPLFAL